MKTEDFIHGKADSASTRGLLLAVAMLMASLPASIGGDVPAAKKNTHTSSPAGESASTLTNGESAREMSEVLEAKAKTGADLTEAERLALGRLLRVQKRWDDATAWYAAWLESAPTGKLKEKVLKEMTYCARKADGWITPPAKDSYTASMRSLEMVFPLTPPKLMEETLEKLLAQFPDRWELLVFRARNFVSLGRLSDAEVALAKAVRLGGKGAQTATQPWREDIVRRQALNATGKQAAALLKSGKKKDAAILLGKAWEKYPDAVEFGLKCCQLRVETRDFEAAAVLSGKIRNYLAEHPSHPMARNSALIAVAAEKSTEAEKLRDKMAAIAKRPASSNPPPVKSSGSGASSSGSMAEKFRRRTQ